MFEAITPLLDKPDKSLSKAAQVLLLLDADKARAVILQNSYWRLDNPIILENLRALNDHQVVIPKETIDRIMRPIESDLAKYPNDAIYGQGLVALARSGDARAEATIAAALKHPNKQVLERAAEAMASLKGVGKPFDFVFTRLDEVGFEGLTKPQQSVAAVQMLINEVNNGGFHQYFFNSSGDYFSSALSGLQDIAATNTQRLLNRAIKLFGARAPSPHREIRIKQLDKLSKKAEAELSALDDEFYKDADNIDALLYL